MDKLQVAHDLAVAAATISVLKNYDVEIGNERPEYRAQQTAACVKDEYERFLDYYKKSIS